MSYYTVCCRIKLLQIWYSSAPAYSKVYYSISHGLILWAMNESNVLSSLCSVLADETSRRFRFSAICSFRDTVALFLGIKKSTGYQIMAHCKYSRADIRFNTRGRINEAEWTHTTPRLTLDRVCLILTCSFWIELCCLWITDLRLWFSDITAASWFLNVVISVVFEACGADNCIILGCSCNFAFWLIWLALTLAPLTGLRSGDGCFTEGYIGALDLVGLGLECPPCGCEVENTGFLTSIGLALALLFESWASVFWWLADDSDVCGGCWAKACSKSAKFAKPSVPFCVASAKCKLVAAVKLAHRKI